jgi:HAD superfamily hydrolase (TIGR01509 family)
MAHFDAVIFDMDGVLIDSEPLHFGVLNDVLALDGYTMDAAENEQFIGTTTDVLFETLIGRHNLPRSVREYTELYETAVLRVLRQPHTPQPGVPELIQRLRQLELRLAVASSSNRAWVSATLVSLGLAEQFETVVSGDDVRHGKPDPEIYLLTAERLRVRPERCVAIEDSPNGVTSAHAAGMSVLGVRTPYTAHLPLPGATRIVESLADLDLTGEIFP